ncbi:collagen-like protein [Capnocytophaga canimorsus]|uniref:collagen-like protein n=1 Tax=Capnocytophaga canimorsus TaxID=28188 RepID=UPI0037D95B24
MVGKFGCNSGNKGNSSVTAYQIAVENGFQGTVQEWLKSLKGERGENGAPGTNGVMGKSAYEIAVENGFQGNVQEWLQSLKGERGEAGVQGPPGPHGEVGPAGMGAAGADGLNGSQIYLVDDISQLNNISSPISGQPAPHDYAIVKSTMELYSLKNTGSNYQIELIGSLKGTTDLDFSDLTGTENVATKQEITDAVDGIKIGGRNFVLISDFETSSQNKYSPISSDFQRNLSGTIVTLSFDILIKNLTTGGRVGVEIRIDFQDGTHQFVNAWKNFTSSDIGKNFKERFSHSTTINNKTIRTISLLGSHIQVSATEAKIGKPKVEKGNIATDWSFAPEDFYNEISTTLLKISTNIATSQHIGYYSQNGRTVVTQGTANIVVTVDSADGFASSYQKGGTGSITFQVAAGKTLVQVDGTNVVDGAKGSTATVTVVDNEVLLRISNV